MFPFPYPSWLQTVHHDGSEQYVSDPCPRFGEKVRLRLRVGVNAPIRQIYVRTFPNGEQALIPMTVVSVEPPVRWWEAELPINQPIVHYRFLLSANDGVWWYTAAGPAAHEPLDVTDFRLLADYESPAWLQEAVFYQIFPDRFANGDPTNDPYLQVYQGCEERPLTLPWGALPPENYSSSFTFYGGDLPGIIQRLDYIQALGANALYLNPIFTACSSHKYDVVDYEHVDPSLGGNEALVALRQALDRRGMRYIMDIVPNHCGHKHPWFRAAQADPNAPEAEFFIFNHHPNDYASWLGVRSLPKLNYRSAELHRRIYANPDAVFRRWLRPPFAADGWRVDVASMLARQGQTQMGAEVAQGIRRAVKETHPEAYLIGETFFDPTAQLQGDQWDGVMNYLGLAIPLWHWLRGYDQGAFWMEKRINSPVSWPTAAVANTWRLGQSAVPWAVTLQQYNMIDCHDTARIRTMVGGNDALHRLAAVVQMTFPGVPGLYYGDEIGMEDVSPLRSRGCMIWDEANWNHNLLNFYRDLIALRHRSPVLRRGGFQILAVEDDTLAYQREGRPERILVVAHRNETPRPAGPLPVAHGGIPDGACFVEHFSGQEAIVANGLLPLPAHPQGATLWLMEATAQETKNV